MFNRIVCGNNKGTEIVPESADKELEHPTEILRENFIIEERYSLAWREDYGE